jgi:hypothetical protein
MYIENIRITVESAFDGEYSTKRFIVLSNVVVFVIVRAAAWHADVKMHDIIGGQPFFLAAEHGRPARPAGRSQGTRPSPVPPGHGGR